MMSNNAKDDVLVSDGEKEKTFSSPSLTSVEDQLMATTFGNLGGPAGPGAGPGGEGDAQERELSEDELWDMADSLFPGRMKSLYDDTFEMLDNSWSNRRSLLNQFYSKRNIPTSIVNRLTARSLNNYTPKINSMLLHLFGVHKRTTKAEFGNLGHKYMRLGRIDDERPDEGYDAELHDVKHLIKNDKTIQLALLFNDLLGFPIDFAKSWSKIMTFEDSNRESYMNNIFGPAADFIEKLFEFTSFEHLDLGWRVKAELDTPLPVGKGRADFAVIVETDPDTSTGKTEISRRCMSIIEFKRPTSGFWIPWGLLTGRGWTETERIAFFELKDLSLDYLDNDTKNVLSSWQNAPLWKSAKQVLEQIGTNRVKVKYVEVKVEEKSDKTKEHSNKRTGSTSAKVSKGIKPVKLTPSYYIEGAIDDFEETTALLIKAKFKKSFDSCHNALAQAASYSVMNTCGRVAIADGLTLILGSLNKLEKTVGAANPSDSDDVLDAHFYNTHMMQTHDRDSLMDFLRFNLHDVGLHSGFLSIGFQLLSLFKSEKGDEIPTIGAMELRDIMKNNKLKFRSENSGTKFPNLRTSRQVLTEGARAAIAEALADLCVKLPEFNTKIRHITSESFYIVEWYRRDIYEVFDSEEPPFPGRSKSVARVQRNVDATGTYRVLKEYYADKDSVARMKRELEAYYRVSKLSDDDRAKHVADLVSFGSLDLNEVPRLFLMLEYVEEPATDKVPIEKSAISDAVEKVDRLLESVGVDHNDLEDRNYKLQLGSDGSWHIKAFDFDHATFR